MSERCYNVLFLCTGNTARSILAESILRKEGAGRFRAFSAGSRPKGLVHPLSLSVLRDLGYPTETLRSKSWEEFACPNAPAMDVIITVCDSAAGETCPIWPGKPVTAHWGVADPAAVEGSEAERRRAFLAAFQALRERIAAFVGLPLAELDPATLGRRLAAIGAAQQTEA